MALAAAEYEREALPELEWENEAHGEAEGEIANFIQALRTLAANASTGIQSQVKAPGSLLRRAALEPARAVLRTAAAATARPQVRDPKAAAALAATLGASLRQVLAALSQKLPLQESEFEWELEGEINPVRKWYPDAMLEHLGHSAAEAEGEEEAEALIGAMIPLAARLVPMAARAIARSAPHLVSGAVGAMKALRRNPDTRPLVRLLPAIVKRTATSIGRQSVQGSQVAPKQAVRTLARETYRVLCSPQQAQQAFRRSQQLDRRLHDTRAFSHATRAFSSGQRCQNCGARVR